MLAPDAIANTATGTEPEACRSTPWFAAESEDMTGPAACVLMPRCQPTAARFAPGGMACISERVRHLIAPVLEQMPAKKAKPAVATDAENRPKAGDPSTADRSELTFLGLDTKPRYLAPNPRRSLAICSSGNAAQREAPVARYNERP